MSDAKARRRRGMLWFAGCVALLAMRAATAEGTAPAPQPAWPLWDGQESVAVYAQRAGLAPTKTLDLGGGVKLELVLVPAGRFVMGTGPEPVSEPLSSTKTIFVIAVMPAVLLFLVAVLIAIIKRRRPRFSLSSLLLFVFAMSLALYGAVRWWKASETWAEQMRVNPSVRSHYVTLTKPYYLGKYEVTQEQYEKIMGVNPSQFKGKDRPVEYVSWEDAQEFCKRLSQQAKLTVRLPTQAEWERACRVGRRTAYHSGDAEADLARVAWYKGNSSGTTHPVGQKEPNAFCLYDMHGNVAEFTQDRGCDLSYSGAPEVDPIDDVAGWVWNRGGHWEHQPDKCQSMSFDGYASNAIFGFLGFRVVVAATKIP